MAPLKITVDAKGEAFSAGTLKAELSTDLAVNLEAMALSLKNLSLTSGDLNLTGQVALNNLAAQPTIDGDLNWPS